VVGEGFGYLGSLALVLAYAIILFGGVSAMLAARDRFALLLAAGLIAMIAFHITVNIGMTVGIVPITGIPLPLMSYSILLNIYVQRDRLVF